LELEKAENGWLCHSDRTGNTSGIELACFGKFVIEEVKGKIENIGCETMANVLCGSLLWTMSVVEAGWSLAPSSF
jgi:hypothetical protein